MKFDSIDRQIFKALFKSGRESLTNLHKIILKKNAEPMSHTGIAKRISKLEDNGILKIQGNININKIKIGTPYFLR